MNKLILLLLFVACGKSPFLETPSASDRVIHAQSVKSDLTFETEVLTINTYFRNSLTVGEEISMLIIMTNEFGVPTSPMSNFKMKLWMPDMGHGSFPVSITNVSAGVFEANEIFFTMPGYWDIHFELHDENNKIVEKVLWGIDL